MSSRCLKILVFLFTHPAKKIIINYLVWSAIYICIMYTSYNVTKHSATVQHQKNTQKISRKSSSQLRWVDKCLGCYVWSYVSSTFHEKNTIVFISFVFLRGAMLQSLTCIRLLLQKCQASPCPDNQNIE